MSLIWFRFKNDYYGLGQIIQQRNTNLLPRFLGGGGD